MKINENYKNLSESYLFSTIAKKVAVYTQQHPKQEIIRLGIGRSEEHTSELQSHAY